MQAQLGRTDHGKTPSNRKRTGSGAKVHRPSGWDCNSSRQWVPASSPSDRARHVPPESGFCVVRLKAQRRKPSRLSRGLNVVLPDQRMRRFKLSRPCSNHITRWRYGTDLRRRARAGGPFVHAPSLIAAGIALVGVENALSTQRAIIAELTSIFGPVEHARSRRAQQPSVRKGKFQPDTTEQNPGRAVGTRRSGF